MSHWHTDLEFIIVEKGRMTYNVNGILTELSENQAIMVNSRQLHYGFSTDRSECEFMCILFSPELFKVNNWFYEKYIEAITENSLMPFLKLDNSGWQKQITDELRAIYQIDNTKACDMNNGDIAENIEVFSVIEHLYKVMKLLYNNMPIVNEIEKRNLQGLSTLKRMLSFLDEDITSIALKNGFGGTSYYCETFRKYYGVSPLQYRKTKSKVLSHGDGRKKT